MSVNTIVQQTSVDSVGSVVITPVTQDPNSSKYVRQIKVYSPPDVAGNVALQFTLQVSADVQASIELTAPAALF